MSKHWNPSCNLFTNFFVKLGKLGEELIEMVEPASQVHRTAVIAGAATVMRVGLMMFQV